MDGHFLIGAEAVTTTETFRAYDPSTGETIAPDFAISTPAHVARACTLADAAFDAFRETTPEARATFLEAIATRIEAIDGLVERAMQESGLPRARLEGERGRTTGQLRLFARVLRQGRWAGVTIDSALPDRAPMPRADLRQRRIAVGPVAVFGAYLPVALGIYAAGLRSPRFARVAGHAVAQAASRARLDPGEVEDVILGCALQQGTTGGIYRRRI